MSGSNPERPTADVGQEPQPSRDDRRLRLFSFAVADKRADYLWVLRAFDAARSGYLVLLRADRVVELIDELSDRRVALTQLEVGVLLDQLHRWGVLERSFDGSRAATLADYRNRHYVYQFAPAGYEAYRAVEQVLRARPADGGLARSVLPELLADLGALVAANGAGDGRAVHRRLTSLDRSLTELAERAAHFYLALADLLRTTEATPETFLAHKDALLTHMRDFTSDLTRFGSKIADAIAAVESTGVEAMLGRAADHDDRPMLGRDERIADWATRWSGLTQWFTATAGRGEPSEADRMRDATIGAISTVLALLRRVTESRRGGISRDSQLRRLAAWFADCDTPDAAHALFDAGFGMGRPRHLSLAHDDPELVPADRSWWESPAVEISRTMAESGRPAAAGAPARIPRQEAAARRLRDAQRAEAARRAAAAADLVAGGLDDRVLDDEQTELLLRLLDSALATGARVSGSTRTWTGSEGKVVLTVSPCEGATLVRTVRGTLRLNNRRVSVR